MAKFFVDRPIVAMVISIIIVIAGLVTLQRLPIAQFPDIIPPEIMVQTTYTGADALTIEQAVATPLEQQINGVDNMIYVKSTNANDGTMTIRVDFEVGTDVNMDQVLVQNRVSQADPLLPIDVKNYGITVQKSLSTAILIFALYSPHNTYDRLFLSNYATININDSLLRVPGLGQVNVYGAANYAMRCWVRPDELAKLGLTVQDLITAIQKQNVVNPAGQIGAEPAPPGQDFTYAVRSQGRLIEAEEFSNIIVRANPDGSIVRLKDISRIELGSQLYNMNCRLNGAPAAAIGIFQIPGSNALDVANGAKKVMKELRARFPEDLEYEVSLDTTLAVTEGIKEIVKTLGQALVLVILVVFLFLQTWRATLIPLLTVPVSLIGTFAVFPMLGFSVNTLSLFGLVLAIGLVVDDAIVVVEAVEHHIEQGLSPREATLKAMSEVSGPVIAIALILSAVFIPVAFMGGITGRLYQQFALTIAISVIISAFNALSLSPALSAMLLKPRHEQKGPLGFFFRGFNRWFERATNGYIGVSGILVRKALRSLIFLVVVAVAAAGLGSVLPTGFVPEEDQGYLYINALLPDAASLQRTDAVCKKMEAILGKTPGIGSYITVGGYSSLAGVNIPYNGFFFVSLKPWEERRKPELSANGIIATLNRQFAAIPEAQAFAYPPPAIRGIGTAGGFDFMVQDRSGGTVEFLAHNVERFLEAARKRPELGVLNNLFRPHVPQLFARVDRDKVMKLGIDIRDVYAALQSFLGGYYVNDFNRFGRQWKVYLQSEALERVKAEDVRQFYVRNNADEMVPLSTLVTMEETAGPEFINRYNLFRAAEITGGAAPGYSSGQAMNAMEEVAEEVLPREMGYAWSGMSYQEKVASGSAAGILALSLLFVFLILAALYESWSLPLSVLLGTPIAVFGAFLGIWARQFDNNIFVQIGMVMLVGLGAKNAILIVEFAKSELEKGKPILEAALAGARLRLRPILMTAFAFILGCVPLWIAEGSGAISRQVLGTAVITGMLASTLIGIFVIPVLFVVVEKIAHRKGRSNDTHGTMPSANAGK